MAQEIISYLIIALAVYIAIFKIKKKITGKRFCNQKKIDGHKDVSMFRNCSSCSAECMLRDTVKSDIPAKEDVCEKRYSKSD